MALTTVRNAVLGFGVEFGGGLAEFRYEEQRVVAEAAFATQGRQDFAVPFAFGDQRLRVFGVAHQHDDRDKMGAPVRVAAEIGEQLFIVAGVGFRLAGIACRIDAGGAAERGDAQAGIVGQGRQAGQLGGMAGFGQRVFDEGAVRLFRFRNAEIALGDDFETERGEERVQLLHFLGVVGSEDEFLHGLAHDARAVCWAATN